MKSKKIILITLMLSVNLIGCSSINNNKFKETQNVEETENLETKKETTENIDNKKDVEMSTYTNPRFGFSISYPKDFILKETSDNNDGAEMSLENVKIIAYGSNNIFEDTVKSLYEKNLKSIKSESVKEKDIKDNSFLISWVDGDMINYNKVVVGECSINSFIIIYPKDEKEIYNSVIKQIEESFKTPAINEAH